MAAETAVIILNWNGARLLPACLSALAAQSYTDYQLWLVDNGSIDGSDRLLGELTRDRQPSWLGASLRHKPRLILNTRNLGFAEGNNQAIRLADCRYMVLLNNDAMPQHDWLASLVRTAEEGGPRVGMVASTMLFDHRSELVASAGISLHADGLALDRGVGMASSALEALGERSVFGPSGGAALYRAALFRDAGLLDGRFFSYLEDVDLAWRARSLGWKALHQPRAKVRHVYSATGGHESPFKRRLISRNRIWTIYKNAPEALFGRIGLPFLRYELLATVSAVGRRDRAMLQGRIEALSQLPRFTDDRRKIGAAARLHPDEIYSLLAPPLGPRQVLKYRKRLSAILSTR